MKKYISDPLVAATLKARKGTSVAKLETLLALRGRWGRKATIAQNKLASVNLKIERLAKDLATSALKQELQ
jgi:hypothetical protein